MTGLIALAAALAIALAAFGSALAQGNVASKALEGMARQPEAAGMLRTNMILALAFIESLPADESGIEVDAVLTKCTDGYLRAFSDRLPRKCGLKQGDMVTIVVKEKPNK